MVLHILGALFLHSFFSMILWWIFFTWTCCVMCQTQTRSYLRFSFNIIFRKCECFGDLLACHLSLLCSESEPHALSHCCSFQLELISHRYVCESMHKSLQQTQKLLGFYARLCVLTTEVFCDHWYFYDSLKQLPQVLLPFCLFLHLLPSHTYIFYFFVCVVCLPALEPKLTEGRNSVFCYMFYRLSRYVCWMNA